MIKTSLKRPAALLLAAMLVLTAGCGTAGDTPASRDSAAVQSSTAGMQNLGDLQHFSAPTLDGGSFDDAVLAQKDLTMINFWSTTCPPCIRELPELEAVRASAPENVQVILVCLDAEQNSDAARQYLADAGYSGMVAAMGEGGMVDVVRRMQYTPDHPLF